MGCGGSSQLQPGTEVVTTQQQQQESTPPADQEAHANESQNCAANEAIAVEEGEGELHRALTAHCTAHCSLLTSLRMPHTTYALRTLHCSPQRTGKTHCPMLTAQCSRRRGRPRSNRSVLPPVQDQRAHPSRLAAA